jgi:hypothetical protein
MTRYSRITGTGSYLPPNRLTNAQLAAELAVKGVETSDDWIVERTGIKARHFAAPGVTSSDLALEAAKRAIEAAGLQTLISSLWPPQRLTWCFPRSRAFCSTSWELRAARPLIFRRFAADLSMP